MRQLAIPLLSLVLASGAQAQTLKEKYELSEQHFEKAAASNASSVGVMASVVRCDFVISTAIALPIPQHQRRGRGQKSACGQG